MDSKDSIFDVTFKVRDYECDLQGIVNNAVYQHYLEHTRNEFIKNEGLALAELHAEGIDPVVARIEIDYKFPLRPNDEFKCQLNLKRDGKLKMIFNQEIIRIPDNKLILKAKVIVVCLKNGIPSMPEKMEAVLGKFWKE